MPTFRAVLACALLGTLITSCSEDGNDAGALESAEIAGILQDAAGRPIPNPLVQLYLYNRADDSPYGTLVDSLSLTGDRNGRFQATFTFDQPTLPLRVSITAFPPFGSGMTEAWNNDSTLRRGRGSSPSSVQYRLTSVPAEPSVIGIPSAALTREVLAGRYLGQSVRPYDAFLGQVYLEINFAPGNGDDLGTFGFEYQASTVGGDGTVLGNVQGDTLRVELREIGGPLSPPRRSTYKVIATSGTADTLIAWPDPCSSSCIAVDAPVRLVREP